jgi:hypothetical protein
MSGRHAPDAMPAAAWPPRDRPRLSQQDAGAYDPAGLGLRAQAFRGRDHRGEAVERARYEADRAERAFVQVEPETVWWHEHWSPGGRPNWLRHGQVPATTRAGRWCIPWDAETQEIYRHKVANSFRLKPIPPAREAR